MSILQFFADLSAFQYAAVAIGVIPLVIAWYCRDAYFL